MSCGCWLLPGMLSSAHERRNTFGQQAKRYTSSKGLSQETQTFCEDYSLYPDLKRIFSKHAKHSQVYQPFYLFISPSLAVLQNTILQVAVWVPLTFISFPIIYLVMSGGE